MTRPPAIRRFEALWLGSTLAWLAGAALSSRARAAMPQLAGYEWMVPAGFALVLAVSAALWWFVARRPSPVARVGVVVIAAVSFVLLVVNLAVIARGGRAGTMPSSLLALLSSGLGIASAATLFAGDARRWFGDADEVEA